MNSQKSNRDWSQYSNRDSSQYRTSGEDRNRISDQDRKSKRGNRRTQIGMVVSDKMDKTVTVSVERSFPNPLYKKIIRRDSKILAHDENNECKIGDQVKVMETRPLSKRKRWRVCEIIQKVQ